MEKTLYVPLEHSGKTLHATLILLAMNTCKWVYWCNVLQIILMMQNVDVTDTFVRNKFEWWSVIHAKSRRNPGFRRAVVLCSRECKCLVCIVDYTQLNTNIIIKSDRECTCAHTVEQTAIISSWRTLKPTSAG